MAAALLLFFLAPKAHAHLGDWLPKAFSDYLWRTAEQLFGALFFGYLGMLTRPLIERYHNCKKFHGAGFLGYCLVIFVAQFNHPVGMFVNDYGNKVIFLTTSLLGIAASVDLAFLLEKSSLLALAGKNSIIVYVTHFRVLDTIFIASSHFLGITATSFPWFMITFILLVIVEIPIIWFANRYVPFLFGKKKTKPTGTDYS